MKGQLKSVCFLSFILFATGSPLFPLSFDSV